MTMNHDSYPDSYIRAILKSVKTVALVGASHKPERPSWIVLKYLKDRGYEVFPINPGLAGQEILGRKVYGRLSGEISWQGVNSRILSAKKPVLAGKGFQKLTINRPGTG